MKKLPIGISSITALLSEGYVYVDKTALIHSLVSERGRYFLSRPRRFGKSLLVDTIDEIMSGHRALFSECAIAHMDYDWHRYPVIRLDFSAFSSVSPEILEEDIRKRFRELVIEHELSIELTGSLVSMVVLFIKTLSQKGPVVILVDEYDKPIIDHMNDIPLAIKNRDILKECFTAFKGCDRYIRFVLITGVSKFSQVSVFSGMNNLKDITLHPDYATLLGYTEPELGSFFKEHIARVAQRRGTSPEELVTTMRSWYNGYRFSRNGQTVYNPTSAMNFLDTGEFANYWFQTGTPTFLIDMLERSHESWKYLDGVRVDADTFESYDVERAEPTALLWQTGYLTIESYAPDSDRYTLNYPNTEVRVSFLRHLMPKLTKLRPDQLGAVKDAIVAALEAHDVDALLGQLQQLIAAVPYNLHTSLESYYQSVILASVASMGLSIRAEEKTNLGRIDLVLDYKRTYYIIECKLDEDVAVAMEQLRRKNYAQKYLTTAKAIFLVGVAFSSKERNISAWTYEQIK